MNNVSPSLSVFQQAAEAATAVRNRSDHRPTIALVLGSGLNQLADDMTRADIIPYDQIPHWPVSTVPGHSGRLILGRLEEQTVLVMQGRAHFYEGYSLDEITLPVRVMQQLGIQTLILTNAAGGINPDFVPGDLMLITDHLNFPGMAGHNPLRGANDEAAGPRFPDMTHAYDLDLRQLAITVADENDIALRQGIYAYVAGPSFETPAELRYLRLAGADAVGMSTAPSVVVARHGNIRVLGVSAITNAAILNPTGGEVTSHEEVLETGKRVIPRLTALIRGILQKL